MPKKLDGVLVVAISSRALFDFEDENLVFDDPTKEESEYMDLQWSRLDQPASPGVGFALCRKLLALNDQGKHLAEVVVLSRNDPISGLRVFRSAQHHEMKITRGAFLRGSDPYPYLKPLQAKLFLSAKPEDVRSAIERGFAAARVMPRPAGEDPHPNELRIAFDGDSVLFGDQAERVYKETKDLQAFQDHETKRVNEPLPAGPLQPFLQALHAIQSSLDKDSPMKIVTALVTARGAPSHERALLTLKSWGVSVDQAFFLDGLEKTGFLQEFQPDFFFDDQLAHIEPAQLVVNSGHVLYGVANEAPPVAFSEVLTEPTTGLKGNSTQ